MTKRDMQHEIDLCLECHRVCLETVTYLQQSGQPIDPDGIRLLFNCAEASHLSAGLLRGNGGQTGRAWGVCAEVCAESAAYCESFGDDPRMLASAQACRRCAEACQHVALLAA